MFDTLLGHSERRPKIDILLHFLPFSKPKAIFLLGLCRESPVLWTLPADGLTWSRSASGLKKSPRGPIKILWTHVAAGSLATRSQKDSAAGQQGQMQNGTYTPCRMAIPTRQGTVVSLRSRLRTSGKKPLPPT